MRALSLVPAVALTAAVFLLTSGCVSSEGTAEATTESAAPSPAPVPFELGPIVAGRAPANPYSEAQIRRGQHLVTVGMCNDCHTPWVFDPDLGIARNEMSRLLSGHPRGAPKPSGTLGPGDMAVIGPTFTSFILPFGVMYAPNLTPDIDTGTGSWTEEMFLDIFRTGRHLGGNGRGVLPPMPWWWVRNLPDEDIVAIFAYLRSVPPINNPVPEHEVPEEAIWGIRTGMDRWVATLPQEAWAARIR